MKKNFLRVAVLAASQCALAQQPPGAGGQLLQIPAVPVPPRIARELRLEQRTAPPGAGAQQVKVVVGELTLLGPTVFRAANLLALTGFQPGREPTLADLQGMAARRTEHCPRHGYFRAQPDRAVDGWVGAFLAPSGELLLNSRRSL